jgi:glycosyltransferase involved in cell wall biosynthesis
MARIGIDAHVLDGKHQGSRTWLANTLTALGTMAGAHCWVIYSADPDRTAALFPSPTFEHRRIGARGALARLLLFWPRAARCDRLDALLTQYIAPPSLRIRSFVVIHDLLFESDPALFPPLMRWRLRLLCRISAYRAAAILTVSRHAAAEIRKRYGIPPERIHLAPNGLAPPVTPDIQDDSRAAAMRPYVLCVGRLEPRKNIGLALAASAAARASGARLVVVGRADFRAANLVRALEAGENVFHIQDASDSLLAALYRHAAALIYPSIGEGFGIPVIEALGHGTAVIASDRTAIPETGGALAVYFDPLAPDAVCALGALIDRALALETKPDPAAVAVHLAQFDWSIAARALSRAADAL